MHKIHLLFIATCLASSTLVLQFNTPAQAMQPAEKIGRLYKAKKTVLAPVHYLADKLSVFFEKHTTQTIPTTPKVNSKASTKEGSQSIKSDLPSSNTQSEKTPTTAYTAPPTIATSEPQQQKIKKTFRSRFSNFLSSVKTTSKKAGKSIQNGFNHINPFSQNKNKHPKNDPLHDLAQEFKQLLPYLIENHPNQHTPPYKHVSHPS